jgi:hypothetical protein
MRIRDGKIRIRDGKKSDPGSGINIPDLQHCRNVIRTDGMVVRTDCTKSKKIEPWKNVGIKTNILYIRNVINLQHSPNK